MNKTKIITLKNNFEAELINELLKQNCIENEIVNENDEFLIFVSNIDVKKAENIINNYNHPEEKVSLPKVESLKSNILKIFALIGGAVLFYYVIYLLYKLILKLY